MERKGREFVVAAVAQIGAREMPTPGRLERDWEYRSNDGASASTMLLQNPWKSAKQVKAVERERLRLPQRPAAGRRSLVEFASIARLGERMGARATGQTAFPW